MADASYGPKVYREQGGDRQVVKSGGSLDVESGGEVDFESGSTLKIAGTALTATAAELNAISGGGLSASELGVLDGVTPGTVLASAALVVDAQKDLASLNDLTLAGDVGSATAQTSGLATLNSASVTTTLGVTGAVTQMAGAATAAVASRFGASVTEGAEIRVLDETVSGFTGAKVFDLNEDMPDGAVLLSVQANIETTVVAAGTSTKVGIGITGNLGKYGASADKVKNTKIDTIPDWAVLSGAEDLQINIVANDGSTAGDSNASAGAVRVRIVYLVPNSLDDAA